MYACTRTWGPRPLPLKSRMSLALSQGPIRMRVRVRECHLTPASLSGRSRYLSSVTKKLDSARVFRRWPLRHGHRSKSRPDNMRR